MSVEKENARGDVLVFSEDPDALAEVLTAGRELAEEGEVMALVVGGDGDALVKDILARGADQALFVHVSGEGPLGAEALAFALQEVARDVKPRTILLAGTRTGAEIAARLGQKLGVPCASDCMAFNPQEDGLIVERRVYGGRFLSSQAINGTLRLATIPLKRFPKAERCSTAQGSIRELTLDLPPPRVRRRSTASRSRSDVDITKAKIIVAAGRGVKRLEDLEILEGLAKTLGGVLAGSRPLTGDVDWLPVDRRVGLSGQTVKPNLYIACGVSGQIEHIVGMKGARTVVAINNDPKAPIHTEADYSIVGDLYEIVPAIVSACKRAPKEQT